MVIGQSVSIFKHLAWNDHCLRVSDLANASELIMNLRQLKYCEGQSFYRCFLLLKIVSLLKDEHCSVCAFPIIDLRPNLLHQGLSHFTYFFTFHFPFLLNEVVIVAQF